MRYPKTKEMEVYFDFAGAEWYCTVSYNPGYEAPRCSNHDDPRFADDGCPAEFYLIGAKVTIDGGKTFKELTKEELEELEEMEETFCGHLEDLVSEEYAEDTSDYWED